jgi:CrcB protein
VSSLLWVGVAALGGIGAVGRFLLDGAVQARVVGEFPLGTFVVNVSGSFALGLLAGAGVTGPALLLAGAATLGSFTTFSTWMLEAERLGEDGEAKLMNLNIALSLVMGFAAVASGWAIGKAL